MTRPRLADTLPRTPLTFDAERAAEALADLFVHIELERWDAPLLRLPTRAAVRDYLVGKGVEPKRAEQAAQATGVPLTVTNAARSRTPQT
jgi:hypothetical protein